MAPRHFASYALASEEGAFTSEGGIEGALVVPVPPRVLSRSRLNSGRSHFATRATIALTSASFLLFFAARALSRRGKRAFQMVFLRLRRRRSMPPRHSPTLYRVFSPSSLSIA